MENYISERKASPYNFEACLERKQQNHVNTVQSNVFVRSHFSISYLTSMTLYRPLKAEFVPSLTLQEIQTLLIVAMISFSSSLLLLFSFDFRIDSI
ncbi:hypothetical protein CDAR_199641 [Caerostris darwini]|uniref:Uncharacterized protein n=1 Tax=Caerostris darwini TaxID=1538125 RepID=A0AAV4V5H1_9ARAC|nr:hypothetical protein CDAR_199641 [Caerostris darwini]